MSVANVLYITYDGLTDPLGRSQVLPYLQGCAAKGHRITILSCEKPDRLQQSGTVVRGLCDSANIEWHSLHYHKRPPVLSGLYDAWMLTRTAAALHSDNRFDLVHCRSYIPASAGLRLKRRAGVPLLFDMRGFWPEEKTEGGAWDLANPLYRGVYSYFKRLESSLLRESDHIISLTEAAKLQLLSRPALRDRADRISVIPCCVDFDHFPIADGLRSNARAKLGIDPSKKVLGYLGSLRGNYMLHEMLEFFRLFRSRNPDALFLFVTMDDPALIRESALSQGIDPEKTIVRRAGREEIPAIIAAADLGVAFKQPSFSSLACSPTKLGEMLAMGIPVIANDGVGDVAPILANTESGVVIREFTEADYSAAVGELYRLSTPPGQIRDRIRRLLDLDQAIERYSGIYDKIAAAHEAR